MHQAAKVVPTNLNMIMHLKISKTNNTMHESTQQDDPQILNKFLAQKLEDIYLHKSGQKRVCVCQSIKDHLKPIPAISTLKVSIPKTFPAYTLNGKNTQVAHNGCIQNGVNVGNTKMKHPNIKNRTISVEVNIIP